METIKMNEQSLTERILLAMQQAGASALKDALAKGVPCVVWRDGQIVDLTVEIKAQPDRQVAGG